MSNDNDGFKKTPTLSIGSILLVVLILITLIGGVIALKYKIDLAEIITVLIALSFILSATHGLWKNMSFNQFLFLFITIAAISIFAYLYYLLNKAIDAIDRDTTPVSPILLLILVLGLVFYAYKMFKKHDDARLMNYWYFGAGSVIYAFLVNYIASNFYCYVIGFVVSVALSQMLYVVYRRAISKMLIIDRGDIKYIYTGVFTFTSFMSVDYSLRLISFIVLNGDNYWWNYTSILVGSLFGAWSSYMIIKRQEYLF